MSLMNRLGNSHNMYQGDYKRVLCVCSAGLLRSPTTAFVLSQKPYNYNTRAAGIDSDFALVVVDEVLLEWAQEVVCMTKEQARALKNRVKKGCKLICLNIPDNFTYRDPQLIKMIKKTYKESKEFNEKNKSKRQI